MQVRHIVSCPKVLAGIIAPWLYMAYARTFQYESQCVLKQLASVVELRRAHVVPNDQ